MDLDRVLAVLHALDAAGVRHWVAGGWGVDILAGRRTRDHRDLDLAFDAASEGERRALAALAELGFTVETDQRPTRVELAGPGPEWVDLHPVEFDVHGNGRQADLADGWFDYPADELTSGVIDGHRIPCISGALQLVFHSGYPHRSVDLHDIAVLRSLKRC